MYNRDDDGQNFNDPYPTTQPVTPTSPTSGPVVGMTPVPGQPGLYYNTAGVVFNSSGTQVDGYVNPATGAFQAGTPVTNPNTGIIQPPGTAGGDPVDPTTPPPPGPGPAPAPGPAPTAPAPTIPGGPAPAPTPNVTPPQPTPPPAFHYADFAPPDPNDLSNDKAFQFENEEGMRVIGARNAALGTLNTGGTLKDYVTFGQNLARTHYNDLFDRSLRTYGINRGNALENYNTNNNTQYKDPWTEEMQRAGLDQNTNQFNSTQGFNQWLENYKRSTLDPFDQKYKTLSLL
jgi:hypothetical protein